ncbi:MAG: RNA polymerase sigma factor RpoD/SigA [Gemmatimonadales bacterium]|nr:MAG: RNA polymerase sigma factor RpoD/SigA [Gemmatimonadales bacterium]
MVRQPDAVGALDQYLDEIRQHPLVSREDEIQLARQIRAGDKRALDRLVAANLRFVVAVARRYSNRGVPLEDLVNEGNLGLMRAARRYDESKGVRFLSYAIWWIRQSILGVLARDGHIVRVPAGRIEQARRVSRASGRLSQSLQRAPGVREVAIELGLAERQVQEAWDARMHDVSLDAPVPGSDDTSFLELLRDDKDTDPSSDLEREQLGKSIAAGIQRLPEREADIVNRYFGFDGRRPETLSEIGRSMGLSRERVRTIKDRALGRLRSGGAGQEIRTFRGD